jgi:hypothetical protein
MLLFQVLALGVKVKSPKATASHARGGRGLGFAIMDEVKKPKTTALKQKAPAWSYDSRSGYSY